MLTERLAALTAEKAKLAAAGICWPPCPWQRVEITGNRYPSDQPGPVLATLLYRDGSYYYVLPDCRHPTDLYPRECYDVELRPVLGDKTQGWVPPAFWEEYMAAGQPRSQNYDLKLGNGRWAFDCFPKPQPAGGVQFQEIHKPYRRYWHHEVVALRPSER